jgi:hypothetical protein
VSRIEVDDRDVWDVAYSGEGAGVCLVRQSGVQPLVQSRHGNPLL